MPYHAFCVKLRHPPLALKQFVTMTTFSIHPCLKKRIEQQLNPAFASKEFSALEKAATGKADMSSNLQWPAPPVGQFSFHCESLMHYLWITLLQIVDQPAETLQLTKGWRAVQVTGCAVFVHAPNSQIQVALWQRDDRSDCSLLQVQPQVVMLTETPHRMLWLARLEDLAVVSICKFYELQGLVLTTDTAETYAHWIFQQFGCRLHQHADLRRMRQRCAQALNLKTELFQVAHRLTLTSKANGKSSFADYNLAAQHAAAILKLQQDAPTMLRLYGALCNQPGFPAHGEPLARIRHQLQALNFSGHVWQLAVKKGARLLLPMREFYSSDSRDSVNDFLCIMAQLDIAANDNPIALRLFFSEFGNADNRQTTYWPQLQPHQAALAHLMRALRKLQPEHQPTEGQIAVVVRWIFSNSIKGWDRAQRQRGWPWLLASAQKWQTLALSQQEANPTQWPVPFSTLQWAGLTFTTLKNEADLILEGHQMRNCAATLVKSCLKGNLLLVGVALPTGKRMATASYRQRAGVWQLTSAKGPANRVLKPGLERLIAHFSKSIPAPCKDTPNPVPLAGGNYAYAIAEEFVGIPDTSAPGYMGTAQPPVVDLVKEGAYGEIGGCDAALSAHADALSAAHAGH